MSSKQVMKSALFRFGTIVGSGINLFIAYFSSGEDNSQVVSARRCLVRYPCLASNKIPSHGQLIQLSGMVPVSIEGLGQAKEVEEMDTKNQMV